jgi:hypothetical protein
MVRHHRITPPYEQASMIRMKQVHCDVCKYTNAFWAEADVNRCVNYHVTVCGGPITTSWYEG